MTAISRDSTPVGEVARSGHRAVDNTSSQIFLSRGVAGSAADGPSLTPHDIPSPDRSELYYIHFVQ